MIQALLQHFSDPTFDWATFLREVSDTLRNLNWL